MKEIENSTTTISFEISENLRKRMSFYIGIILYETTLINQLRGRKLSAIENQRACFLGALTPLFDDLNDELNLDTASIKKLFDTQLGSEDPRLQFAQFLDQKLEALTIDSPRFFEVVEETTVAQDRSMAQLESLFLSPSELRKISREKGGYAAMLYASLLEKPPKPNEELAQFELGYSLQLINDMFDIWKDKQNKQQTLFTNSADWNQEAKEFEHTLENVYSRFLALDYSPKDTRRFFINISILYGRAQVCLEQLLALQAQKGTLVTKHSFERKELICDMEKPKNIWSAFRFSMALYKRYYPK